MLKKILFSLLFFIMHTHLISMEKAGSKHFFNLCNKSVIGVKKFLRENPLFDINRQDDHGATMLLHASADGHWKIVWYLLKHFKTVNIMHTDNCGQSLFSDAVYYYCVDLNPFKRILKMYSLDEINILCKTIPLRRDDDKPDIGPNIGPMLEAALEGKGDVDATDYQGTTALHTACCSDYIPYTVQLLKRGARLDMQDGWNETPYDELQRYKASLFVVREAFNDGSCFADVPVALIYEVLKNINVDSDAAYYIKQLYFTAQVSEHLESPKARIWQPVCVDACKIAGIEEANERRCLDTILLMPREKLTQVNVALALENK